MHVEPWKGLKEHPGQDRFLANLNYSRALLTIQIAYMKLERSYLLMFRAPTLFRVMDEGDLLRFQKQFKEPVFAGSFIYELFDTELINFCFEERDRSIDKAKYRHFAVVSDDDFIDIVLIDDEPTITAIDL
ncbi:hypothetical protein [Alishewanella sp. SMS8]|uniref:hypothetical protein n=1 Tax=Alishewanella sp. SMS8 TaxID=2994676 RepID=UPI0027427645|nr:hypothetical protein [Alishewanella sp. SMS8]MDP5460479.1 hypothetical protein [Alishewanella sp. SMS8]